MIRQLGNPAAAFLALKQDMLTEILALVNIYGNDPTAYLHNLSKEDSELLFERLKFLLIEEEIFISD